MDGLVIGIDISDTYTRITLLEPEKSRMVPTVICNKKESEEWFVGEEAYGCTLAGEGVIVDKLLNLAGRSGTATIGGVKYEGAELLAKFFAKLLEYPCKEAGTANLAQVAISLEKPDGNLLKILMRCMELAGVDRSLVHVLSRTESFVYYVMSQKRDVWSNQVGMFSLENENLAYYELKAQRGLRQMTVVAERESQEESFNLNVLDTPSGARLADRILCSCGERLLQKKIFSAVILTGKGFERNDWAPEFMKFICRRRRVFGEDSVFSKGAAYKAADYLHEKTSYPFVCICEGRLKTSVSMKVMNREKEEQLYLASAGDSWYESGTSVDVILDGQSEIEFLVSLQDTRQKKLVRIPLDGFPKRPNKTTRVGLSVEFLDERTMVVNIKDKGFGELFPASEASVRQEVML